MNWQQELDKFSDTLRLFYPGAKNLRGPERNNSALSDGSAWLRFRFSAYAELLLNVEGFQSGLVPDPLGYMVRACGTTRRLFIT